MSESEQSHLEIATFPQNEEWIGKIRAATDNYTKCCVITELVDGAPHKPWLFVPLKSQDGGNVTSNFFQAFKKITGKEYNEGISRDGLTYQFNLPQDLTPEQIQSLIQEIG